MAQLTPLPPVIPPAQQKSAITKWLDYFEFGFVAGLGFMAAATLISIAIWCIGFLLIVFLGLSAAAM